MELAGATIGVTGATGFIGRYFCRVLKAHGAHVVGVVRTPNKVPELLELGCEMRKADLGDQASLEQAFSGLDGLVSNAALVALGTDPEALIRANVGGTENVCRAAATAGVKRIVHISSATVYRPKASGYYGEDDPLRLPDDPVEAGGAYAHSKACSEHALGRLAEEFGLEVSIARPHVVYGAFDNTTFTKWFKRAAMLPILPWPTKICLPFVYAGDIAEAAAAMLQTPESIGRAYNICGPVAGDDFGGFLRSWQEAGGGGPLLTLPIPSIANFYRYYQIARASRELGWKNRSLVQGFSEMIALETRFQT